MPDQHCSAALLVRSPGRNIRRLHVRVLSYSQMPTYEFVCPNGHHFDKFYRKMSDSVAELPCPECGAVAARQISGGAGLVFKGSGFYITDYGKDGKKGMTPAPSSSTTGGGDSKASDSSGAAKSDGASSGAPPASAKPAAAAKVDKAE